MDTLIELLADALPLLGGLALLLVSPLVGRAVLAFERRMNIDVSREDEEKLKRAIGSGLAAFMARRGVVAADLRGGLLAEAAAAAADHVFGGGAPDAAKRLGATRDDVGTLARAAVAKG